MENELDKLKILLDRIEHSCEALQIKKLEQNSILHAAKLESKKSARMLAKMSKQIQRLEYELSSYKARCENMQKLLSASSEKIDHLISFIKNAILRFKELNK